VYRIDQHRDALAAAALQEAVPVEALAAQRE
jgi:hypothetical protein